MTCQVGVTVAGRHCMYVHLPSEEVDERAVEVEHCGAGVDPVLVVLARRQRVRKPRLRVGRHVGLDQLGDPLRRFVACNCCIE